jgi:hypothetical protein
LLLIIFVLIGISRLSSECEKTFFAHAGVFYFATETIDQFLQFWDDVTISFLVFFVETTEKKAMRLFIIGYFLFILRFYQFDNFLFLSLITLIVNITFRSNCQQI